MQLFSRSLHHFFAEEFKGSLNRGGSQYLLRSFPLPLRQSLLARTPSYLVCQIQLCMFSPVPSFQSNSLAVYVLPASNSCNPSHKAPRALRSQKVHRYPLGVLVPLSPWTWQQDSVWKIITGSAGRQRGPWTGLYNISRISTIKTSFLDHCKIMQCLRRRYAHRFHSEHFLSQVLGPRLLMWTELWIIWVPDEEVKYLYLL